MKIIIETEDKTHARCLIAAVDMAAAIQDGYSSCLRNYIKHGVNNRGKELNEDQREIVEEINDNLREHFEEFYDLLGE